MVVDVVDDLQTVLQGNQSLDQLLSIVLLFGDLQKRIYTFLDLFGVPVKIFYFLVSLKKNNGKGYFLGGGIYQFLNLNMVFHCDNQSW